MEQNTLEHNHEKIGVSDLAHEILEDYWVETEEKGLAWSYTGGDAEPITKELLEKNMAVWKDGVLTITNHGRLEARSCVRRHRLAEKLFADVLHVRGDKNHELGCEMEHLLQTEVAENICTLLGHPTMCPHDKPIPEGDCCRDEKRMPRKLVRNLTECELGETGLIAYLKTEQEDTLNKLTAMGVLPGLPIKLIKRKPGFLFQMGQSQFVVDRELASMIQVRFSKN
ncbi:MAG: DtxR family Mn-dependent transcriptional regulator [Candidatus Omnitrophota bacterium]|jgi:DtxR family Mn-dependent transcriptional regulator